MIRPVNGHLLIEPLAHQSFISQERETFEEVGVIVDNGECPHNTPYYGVYTNTAATLCDCHRQPKKGDKVYFDSWLAKKYPKGDTEADGYYWLVKWDDVSAVDYDGNENSVSK